MTCPVCCVARRDFDLIEEEKPAAFRPLSLTPAQLSYFFDLPMRLFCAVAAALFAEGLLSSISDSIVNLANGVLHVTFVTTLLASACHLLRVALRQHQYQRFCDR